MATRWHIQRDAQALALARILPARFDVSAETVLPLADPLRLAHQIRQDMWRALQRVRGFSPVVRLEHTGAALQVTAGGRLAGRVPPNVPGVIADILSCPRNRARWVRHANRSQHRFEKFDLKSESPS